MNNDVRLAYEALVPRDQIVVDAMIISLYEKDAQLRKVLVEVECMLSKPERTERDLNE
jgi:hypothetical protein